MDNDNARYLITTLNVYELQNKVLDEQNAWCSTTNEDSRDRLYWWQGVMDAFSALRRYLQDYGYKIEDESPEVENE